jgi:RimJ/RimL family protein N-acetyltransferase
MNLIEPTGEVSLRPLRTSDSALLYEWVTDRELRILSAPYWPVSEVDHQKWVEKALQRQEDAVILAIETISGATVGICKLLRIDWISRSAELQIKIGDPSHQGKGLGTAAVNLLCNHGFNDLGLHRIYLQVWSSNTRAKRVYEKAKFSKEGTLRDAAYVDGEFHDVVVMARLDSD